ncbi:MAG TPA: primosomal protein N' [candidate division Zixibacteria bacterium]|nr:primosomal protein N' [candidate division Zixibacteria bacterium]
MGAPTLFSPEAGANAHATAYCDVALPVPLEATFTYEIGDHVPVVGGRVIVPFRTTKLSGIVTRLHDEKPEFKVKRVAQVLDSEPVLDEKLLALGQWISNYYLAPIGEALRMMLPLQAEFRQQFGWRITAQGADELLAGVPSRAGRSARSSAEEHDAALAVLDHLADGDVVREESLRAATGATREVLRSLAAKKWIAREDLSGTRDARRIVKFAQLVDGAEHGKLNPQQQLVIDSLKEGRVEVSHLRATVSASSLATLVKRGVVQMVEEALAQAAPTMKPRTTLEFIFTAAQKEALRTIQHSVNSRKFGVHLLHGVTGSGKTAVYLAAMQAVLKAGRGAILLVPEIGLTPGVAADLHGVFGEEIAILHSSLTDRERAEQWHRLRRGEAHIAVGTRSAVFAPVRDLALIIVDEEHDHSYKQEETPRYHARDVAAVRARDLGATVVLGSATPSLESWNNTQKGKFNLIELPERVQARSLPEVELVDMRAEFQATGKEHVLSRKLIEEVQARLERGEQAMILLNRRGYSAFVMCRACGDTLQCRDCAVALTHHKREHRLVCHYCGYKQPIPKHCPKCGSDYVQFLGTGSEKLEDIMHAAFPTARIGRMDRDTVRGHADFEEMLSTFAAGEIDLLVGTQMIAKGHDVHGVTLVGVVNADTALTQPDFRSAERVFQLLTQVAGRAGRGETPGRVVVQTLFPEHYAVQFAATHDFRGFADKELRFRSWMHYPPFTSLANVLIRSDKQEEAMHWSGVIGRWFERTRHEGVRVMGPAVAPLLRLKKDFRYHFVLKAESRERLNALLRAMVANAVEQKVPRTSIVIDVDALSLQ